MSNCSVQSKDLKQGFGVMFFFVTFAGFSLRSDQRGEQKPNAHIDG